MRNHSSLFIAFAFLISGLRAQEATEPGFLNIVNLIPGKIPAEVRIDDTEIIPDGMKSGDYTGWFIVPSGEKSLTIVLEKPKGDTKSAIAKASGKIEITPGIANVVAMFLQPSNRIKADGTPFPPKIRIRSFPAYESRGFGLKFISLCTSERRFQIGSLKLDTKPLEPIDIPKWSGAGFEVIQGGKAVGKTTGSSEPDSFYLLVAEDANGGFITTLIRSGIQQAPPWIKKAKEAEKSEVKP